MNMDFNTVGGKPHDAAIVDVACEAVGLSIKAEQMCGNCRAMLKESSGRAVCPKCRLSIAMEE